MLFRLQTVNLTTQCYCNIAPPKVLMPKVTKISLHCAEAEQVEGSNLGEGIPGQVPTWEVSQGT